MAFTTAPPPTDKEQGAFWQANEELCVANDNFFDQYVSFETVERTTLDCASFCNPPSPSILLDSLDCLTNSSDGQDQPPAQHSGSVPALYDNQPDLALGRSSISDSELLSLEGISLRSPRVHNSAASGPRPMPSSPLSPRRSRRFVDSVHATVGRAAHHPCGPGQVPAAAPLPDIKPEPGHQAMLQRPENVVDGLVDPAYGPIDSYGMPLSPPLTGELPMVSQQPVDTQFVISHLEDPFSQGYVALHPARTRPHGERTPLYTPVFRNDGFGNATQPLDLAHSAFKQHKQRSTSSAEWPVGSPAAKTRRAPGAAGHDGPDGRNLRGRPYEGLYEPADGLSGLMIHMPRPPPAAAQLLIAPMPSEPPRKPSALPSSASRPLFVPHHGREDEPPASPTPAPSSAFPRRHSSSVSVREQRSWSRREPGAPNLAPSTAATTAPTTPVARSPCPGGGGLGFVNFTPSDKKVLMHGVAPSGSSKTKARREKEALDRRRKLNEAAYKAVAAAGGDLERLRAEVSSL